MPRPQTAKKPRKWLFLWSSEARLAPTLSLRDLFFDQLNEGDRGGIAGTEAAFEQAEIAAWAIFIARCNISKEFADSDFVTQSTESQPTVSDGIYFSQGNEGFENPTQFFGLRQCGAYDFVVNNRRCHITKHSHTVGAGTTELSA
jgi:hypothetical protein